MRLITLAALLSVVLITPCLGQSMAANQPASISKTNMTVTDGSDAGNPVQPAVLEGVSGGDTANLADLPREATHAPTLLGRPVKSGDLQ
jgi:hypothetical protein